ncbi:hypothetical protein V6C27_00895 [Peptococcaceae bacterium 1198_IL3148]
MSQSVYSVVKIYNNEPDDVAVFDSEDAAVAYADELADREDYQMISIIWTKLNNTNMQVTVKEMRK